MPGKGPLLGIGRNVGRLRVSRLLSTVHHRLLCVRQRSSRRFDAPASAALFDEVPGFFYQPTCVVKLFQRLCAREG